MLCACYSSRKLRSFVGYREWDLNMAGNIVFEQASL